jgi:ATPase complex subunit ATP10
MRIVRAAESNKRPKCTLVAISFRDYGYKQLSSWTDPVFKAFEGQSARDVNIVRVSITERWSLYLLKGFLTGIMRKNTPVEEHDRTLLYFGSNVDEFRDVLRMHNLMVGYVFLVDDLGRIRWAGSGPASSSEADSVIQFAKELTPLKQNKSKSPARQALKKRPKRGRPL